MRSLTTMAPGFVALLVFTLCSIDRAFTQDSKTVAVPPEVRKALEGYLIADAKTEDAALQTLLGLVKQKPGLALAALRSQPPLDAKKPGVYHGLAFTSGGATWEYSIALPKGYDGKKRFPVLVLPDHGAVDAKAGIGFWENQERADEYVVFRPVITKFQDDKTRFPDQSFFPRDSAIARVFHDALRHLRLHYAVDPDRFVMTGLSQSGYYTWYYAASFPDEFAAIVPESAGGPAVLGAVKPLAQNLAGLAIRQLHTEGDRIVPYGDAVTMRDAVVAAGGKSDLITYKDADYGADLWDERHPGPHRLRAPNVLPFGLAARRALPARFTRVLRYPQQGREGRFRIPAPDSIAKAVTVTCSDENGALECSADKAVYLASPDDVLAGRLFKVRGRDTKAEFNVKLLLVDFKSHGDLGRLAGAEIPLSK